MASLMWYCWNDENKLVRAELITELPKLGPEDKGSHFVLPLRDPGSSSYHFTSFLGLNFKQTPSTNIYQYLQAMLPTEIPSPISQKATPGAEISQAQPYAETEAMDPKTLALHAADPLARTADSASARCKSVSV